MHKSLPPFPLTQGHLPCTNHPVWHQLPPDKRQPCHELMAQRLIHVSHSAPSEACQHEQQEESDPSPT